MKQPTFAQVSAALLNNHRDAVVTSLQQWGYLVPPSATDDQLITAYLAALADHPGFKDTLLTNMQGSHSVDGTQTPTLQTASSTAKSDTLSSILNSPVLGTVLTGASNILTSNQQLKEQANQIKLAQLNLQNNQVVASASNKPVTPGASTGMSAGTVILISVLGLVVIGGVILIATRKKTPAAPGKKVATA